MYEINWSVEGVLKLKAREKEKNRNRSRVRPKKLSPQERREAREAEHTKRLEEYHAFSEYKQEILQRAREKRRERDVGY